MRPEEPSPDEMQAFDAELSRDQVHVRQLAAPTAPSVIARTGHSSPSRPCAPPAPPVRD
jgi:hypothetical protein